MDQETQEREEAEKPAPVTDTDIKTLTAVIWIGGMLLVAAIVIGGAWLLM